MRSSTCGRITANGLDSYGLPEQSSGAVRRSGKRPPRERIGRRSDGKGGPDHFALASHMSVRVRVRSDEPTNPVCVYACASVCICMVSALRQHNVRLGVRVS